ARRFEVCMTPRARMLIAATAFLAALSGCQGLTCPFCRPGSYCPIHHTYTLTEQEQQELLASKAAEEKRLREAEERRKVHKPAVSADGGPILPGVARTTTVGKRFGDGASQNTPAATTDERSSGVSVLPAGPFYPLGTEQPSEPSERGPILQAVTDKRDEPAKEPLLEAMRCVLENRPSDALAYLQTYDHPTQEFFLRMLPPMALLAHKKLDKLSPGEVAVLNEQLESLLTTLRPQTELVIGTMCFCEAVKSYGVYDRVPDDHVFQAGSGGQPGERVLLYVELHNFCSERRASYHETRLASAVEIT